VQNSATLLKRKLKRRRPNNRWRLKGCEADLVDSCGHDNEPLSFATGVEFLDHLTRGRLLKKVSASWSLLLDRKFVSNPNCHLLQFIF
jgi:hypothetical protein